MAKQKTLNFRERLTLRRKLAHGENRKSLVDELISKGFRPIDAENEIFFEHVRLKNPLGNFLFNLIAIYILTVSIAACAFLYFGDARMVLLISILGSLFASVVTQFSPNSEANYSNIGFVALKWLTYAIFLTTSIALFLTEDWNLGPQPNDKFIVIWAILYAAMFIGLKLIGVILFISVHLAIIFFYQNVRIAFVVDEAQRQRNNYMLLLASQLALKLEVPFDKSLKLGERVVDALSGCIPNTNIEIDFEDLPRMTLYLDEESLSVGVLSDQLEQIDTYTSLSSKSWKWRVQVPNTPYFY